METEESAERISFSLKAGDQRHFFRKTKSVKGFIVSGYYAMIINSRNCNNSACTCIIF